MSAKKTIVIARPRQSQVQPFRIQLVRSQTTQAEAAQPNAGYTMQHSACSESSRGRHDCMRDDREKLSDEKSSLRACCRRKFQIVLALFHFQILIGENKTNKKNHVGKMGFPHLPGPPAPSLESWVQTFSCQKRPCGQEIFLHLSRVDVIAVFRKFP